MSEEGEERSLVGNEAERKRVEELERADYQKTLKETVTTHTRFSRPQGLQRALKLCRFGEL